MIRLKNILIIGGILIIPILIFIFGLNFNCPLKKYLHIACPGCGLTRSISALMNFDILKSLHYNLLTIPLIIIAIVIIINLIYDTIKNRDNFIHNLSKILGKNYKLIILILISITIINNINNI